MAERSKKGLVLRDVTVKRGGKTFTQKRWVKAGEDEPEEKKPSKKEEVKDKESYKIGEQFNFLGDKYMKVEKVSESEQTVKLSNGLVYTFDAIKAGKKGISGGKHNIGDKINFQNVERTITSINQVSNTVELDNMGSVPFKELDKLKDIPIDKPKKDTKIKDLKPIKKLKEKEIKTKNLSKQMEDHASTLKEKVGGEKLLNGILQYTGGDYKFFNDYLRSGKMHIRDYAGKVSLRKPTKGKAKEMDEKMNVVSDFLKNAPKMKGTVYRGMVWQNDKKSLKEFDDFINNVNNNNNIEFPNFSSTSTSKETAMDFATSAKGVKSVVIEMKSKNGVYLNGTSAFEDEDEVLFDKSSNFKVIKFDQESEPNLITLEEI